MMDKEKLKQLALKVLPKMIEEAAKKDTLMVAFIGKPYNYDSSLFFAELFADERLASFFSELDTKYYDTHFTEIKEINRQEASYMVIDFLGRDSELLKTILQYNITSDKIGLMDYIEGKKQPKKGFFERLFG